MYLISKQEIIELSEIKNENCISIFIPTNRAGEKVLQEKDSLKLKNQLKEVKQQLKDRGLNEPEIKNQVKAIEQLLDDSSFWRDQSDGLAIFIAGDFVKVYTLPIDFEAFTYISHSFYIKPLMPMFVGDGEFYLLLLQRNNVALYECTQHTLTEIILDNLIPLSMEELIGTEDKEKHLQFRTGQTASGKVMYHGHEKENDKHDLKRYLKAISVGIVSLCGEDQIPMVVASQDFIYDIFKEVNAYPNLLEKNINLDFEEEDIFDAHELAWEHIAPHFDQTRKDKMAAFKELHGTGNTAVAIDNVLPKAFYGAVETLFCTNQTDSFGTYENENSIITVTSTSESDPDAISLMNEAVVQTFLHGGEVYLLDKEDMPDSNSNINAILRF